ncbi:bifunctional diguanylate cyclase/phosphodiesterase [Selenomonas sp.]|uniref:putative bifunctional diguanylate cyclase/phosphodiesterase n=1 Tax=Selenomonas sp. TaxID=2053611 RepID=UPI0025F17DD1|nr:bifunctional diguanylate cyclase/phosphodiesterase [Selenomonas sp.]MCI6284434.1 bifunctional diguanylate cyclase/phosphodiesterase [Selenomonas sp.]
MAMDWNEDANGFAGFLRRERRDELTGLPTMMAFMEQAARQLPMGPSSFLYFNVENFRVVNQEFGFTAGNHLLVRIAGALEGSFGPVPMARLNDDRFVVMTRQPDLDEKIQAVIETVEQAETRIILTVKVGIYAPPPGASDIAIILDRAKLACDSIKGMYDQTIAYFDPAMEEQRSLQTYILTNFYRALAENWIEVWYQPEIRAATREVCGFEALARWRDPVRGIISPAAFIPVLENAHLIDRLDLYIIQHVCEDQLRGAKRPGWKSSHISVNLSRVDFQLRDMLGEIEAICRAYSVPKGYLHIEITESALTEGDEFLKKEIQRFHAAGFEMWMDDFGSGYSSLNNLKDFAFDVIKIDMAFLRDFETKPQTRVILEAIVDMAKRLDIRTLCEGVETEEQYAFLRSIGCEVLQGYLFSPPMPFSEEHTGEVAGADRAKLLVIEDTAAEPYFRNIGRFNVLASQPITHWDDPSKEQPLALGILEVSENGTRRYLYASAPFQELADTVGFLSLEEAAMGYKKTDKTTAEQRFWQLVDRAMQSGRRESMENFIGGRAYSVRMAVIARDEARGVMAVAIHIVDLSELGVQHQQRLLDIATRHMLQMYTRLDVFCEDGRAENLVIDASQQRIMDRYQTNVGSLQEYATMYIAPEDRKNFLAFYDFQTVEERSLRARSDHTTAVFRVLDEATGAYGCQMFTLIPFRLESKRYVLSCVRPIDNLDRERSTEGFEK